MSLTPICDLSPYKCTLPILFLNNGINDVKFIIVASSMYKFSNVRLRNELAASKDITGVLTFFNLFYTDLTAWCVMAITKSLDVTNYDINVDLPNPGNAVIAVASCNVYLNTVPSTVSLSIILHNLL